MEKTYQLTESALQALLKEQRENCYDESDITYETLGSNIPEPVVSKRSILNAPTPDLSHLKEAPQPKQRAKYDVSTLGEKLNDIFDMAEYYLDDDLGSLQEVAGSCVIRKWDFESIKRSILHAAAELPASEEAPQLHLKELRERFEKKLCAKGDYEFCFNADYIPKEIFEWFVSNLQLPKEDTSIHQIK